MTPNSTLNMFVYMLLGLTTFASAHTWIEQMTVIAPNGTFVGEPGFPRGNVLRTSPSFSDAAMTNLIPPDGRSTGNEILSTDPMCMPSQQSQTQTAGSPRLQAAAGSAIALRYQENGHVTLPNNQPGKPANRGTVFVYGTTQPSSSDTLLAIHRVWNADQTGGDKRGVLLSSQNFDDGQCYQVNSSPISAQRQAEFPHTPDALMGINMWCQQDIVLPANAPSGQPYTLYWVWDWPTAPGVDPGVPNGKQELYTTCMDVDIISGGDGSSFVSSGFIANQDLNYAAVPSEFAQINNPTAVAAPSEPPDVSNGAPGTGVAPTSQPAQPTFGAATQSAATSPPAQPTFGAATQSAATPPPAQPTFGASTQDTATPQAASTGFGGNGGENGGGHFSRTRTTFAVVTSSAQAFQPGPSQAIVPGTSTDTVTQYDSVTQTVYHTIYPSGFKKRTITQTIVDSTSTPSSSVSSSTLAKFELRGRGPRLFLW